MKDFNNDKNIFNKSIKKKFDAARIEPSDAVWEGIEGALLKHENVKMHKRAVFYRNIAAAILLIAAVSIYFNLQEVFNGAGQNSEVVDITDTDNNNIISSGSGLYASQSDVITPPQVVENKSSSSEREGVSKTGKSDLQASSINSSSEQELMATTEAGRDDKHAQEQFSANSLGASEGESLAVVNDDDAEKNNLFINDLPTNDNMLSNSIVLNQSSFEKIDNIKPGSDENNQIAVPDLQVEEVSYFAISNLDQAKNGSDIAFQSAFNVGSGSFNPNANVSPGAPQPAFASLNAPPGTAGRTSGDPEFQDQYSAERQVVDDLSNAPIRSNISMTFGLQFGVHLSDRLKVRTGLQYGNYRSSTESSAVIRDMNSDQVYPYHGASNATELADGKIVNITSEYNVQNDFQILSVPLIVSYKFLDRKFGIGLVAGATADIMLRNTIRGGDEQISEISFENNESQSYKNLFYSGIAGVEFSYNFSKNYSLSLTPTYKKAFMNITNDDASFNSTPDFLSVDMSIQFTF